MAIVLIILFCLSVSVCALVGALRRCTKTSLGGAIVLLTLLLVRAVGSMPKDKGGYGIIMLIVPVALLVAFICILTLLKHLLGKAVEARRIYAHYQNMDNVEEQEAYILDAVDKGDKKKYKEERKKLKKIKDKTGVWGILDVVFGGVAGGLNGAIVSTSIIVGFLMFTDVSGIYFLNKAFEQSLTNPAWTNFGSKLAIDLVLIGCMYLVIMAGYKGGISSMLCFVTVMVLLAGFGAGAWAIAYNIKAESLSGLTGGFLAILPENLRLTVARIIIAAIIFLLSLIIVVLVAIFLPKLVDKLRGNKVFTAVDGVFGALIVGLVVLFMFIALGGIAYSLNDLSFMAKFNGYEAKAFFGSSMYDHNPLASLFGNIPLRKLFGE